MPSQRATPRDESLKVRQAPPALSAVFGVSDRGAAGWVFLVNKLAGKSLETPPHQDNHYLKLHPPNCLTIWHAPPPSKSSSMQRVGKRPSAGWH